MKKILSLMAFTAIVVAFSSCNDDDDEKALVINFNGLLQDAESEYVGTIDPDAGQYDYTESTFTDPSGSVTFNHYTTNGGSYFGGGFTYTNKTDKETMSYTNPSAITGKGVSGNTYLVCNTDGTYRNAIITLKNSTTVKSAYFTNSTYAYLSMKNGDFSFGTQPFGDNSWFKLTITGWSGETETGSVTIDLAKGTQIVNAWILADLSSLGVVDKLTFGLTSSDNGQWGMNTPAYFCMDALKIAI